MTITLPVAGVSDIEYDLNRFVSISYQVANEVGVTEMVAIIKTSARDARLYITPRDFDHGLRILREIGKHIENRKPEPL